MRLKLKKKKSTLPPPVEKKTPAGRGFLFLASVFELTELPKYHHVAQHYANTSLPVITGVLGRNLFFRATKPFRSSNAHGGDGTADCVKCAFLTGNGERETRGCSVCADFSAKQMFISISECSCETIRLHYQEHTNYLGARAKRRRAQIRAHLHGDKYVRKQKPLDTYCRLNRCTYTSDINIYFKVKKVG